MTTLYGIYTVHNETLVALFLTEESAQRMVRDHWVRTGNDAYFYSSFTVGE